MGSRLIALAAVAGVLALPLIVALAPIDSSDAWWHVAIGRLILDEGRVVDAEPFSHTAAGAPFPPQEWLSQTVLALADRTLGPGGLRALTALLVLGGGLLVWLRARLAGLDRPRAAMVVALLAPPLAFLVEPRPHLFSFVFFAAFTCLATRRRPPGPRALAGAFLLVALWSNFHAVAVLAPLVAGAAWVESLLARPPEEGARLRRLLMVAATGLAALCNPSAFGLYRYAFFNPGRFAGVIDEWTPFWFAEPPVAAAGLAVSTAVVAALGLGVAGMVASLRRRQARGVVQALGLAYLVLSARRWLWLGWAPALHGLRRLPAGGRWRTGYTVAAVLLAAAPLLNPRVQRDLDPARWRRGSVAAEFAPLASAGFLRDLGLEGKLYHPYHWGGFLLYWLHPGWQVYLYGETEVFLDAGVLQERQRIEVGPEPQALQILERRGVRAMVVPRMARDGRPARPPGGDGPGEPWIRAFANLREAVWLRRDDPAASAAAARYYREREIRWDPELGFLEHEAFLGNPGWSRATEQAVAGSLEEVFLPLAARLRADPRDPRSRALLVQALQKARFPRSAAALQAAGR